MPNIAWQTQLKEDIEEWQRQNIISQLASDNGDIAMFQEAQAKIHEIEARNRREVFYVR